MRIDGNGDAMHLTIGGFAADGKRQISPGSSIVAQGSSIVDFWKKPNHVKFDEDDKFDNEGLENIIKKYKYILMFKNEDN